MLRELLAFMTDHEKLVENAMKGPSMSVLLDGLGSVICSDLELTAQRDARVLAAGLDPHTLAAFLSGGTVQLARQWWADGCPADGVAKMDAALAAFGALARK